MRGVPAVILVVMFAVAQSLSGGAAGTSRVVYPHADGHDGSWSHTHYVPDGWHCRPGIDAGDPLHEHEPGDPAHLHLRELKPIAGQARGAQPAKSTAVTAFLPVGGRSGAPPGGLPYPGLVPPERLGAGPPPCLRTIRLLL